MTSGTIAPGGSDKPRPEKITTVSIPDLKLAGASPGGLGVVGLEGMGVVEREVDIDMSFVSFFLEPNFQVDMMVMNMIRLVQYNWRGIYAKTSKADFGDASDGYKTDD